MPTSVKLDKDPAMLYKIETTAFIRAIKRNNDQLREDFIIQLPKETMLSFYDTDLL